MVRFCLIDNHSENLTACNPDLQDLRMMTGPDIFSMDKSAGPTGILLE